MPLGIPNWFVLCSLKCCDFFLFKANAIGRSAKTVREYLEKHYNEEQVATDKGTIKLALRALMEVVQSGAKNVEFAVMRRGERLKVSKPVGGTIVFSH